MLIPRITTFSIPLASSFTYSSWLIVKTASDFENYPKLFGKFDRSRLHPVYRSEDVVLGYERRMHVNFHQTACIGTNRRDQFDPVAKTVCETDIRNGDLLDAST